MSRFPNFLRRHDNNQAVASLTEIIRTREEAAKLQAQLEEATTQLVASQREAKLRQLIGIAISRYFIKGDRSASSFIPYADVTIDSNEDWIPEMLARTQVSEPEFTIFKHFDGVPGTVLDIGANYGYAAASMWAAGLNAQILSFEPNPWHIPCLRQIKAAKAGQFDYANIGLGDQAYDIQFVMPVVEGVGISALMSAVIQQETDWTIPENLLHHLQAGPTTPEDPRVQFTEATFRIERLDDILESRAFEVDLSKISAIKIDVEGFESDVLRGGGNTLINHQPLLMIEGGNRNAVVTEFLNTLGYRHADFENDALILSDNLSHRNNGFFLHQTKLEQYTRIGLLVSR